MEDYDPGRYATEWRGVLGDRRAPKGAGILLALAMTILSIGIACSLWYVVALAAYLDAAGL